MAKEEIEMTEPPFGSATILDIRGQKEKSLTSNEVEADPVSSRLFLKKFVTKGNGDIREPSLTWNIRGQNQLDDIYSNSRRRKKEEILFKDLPYPMAFAMSGSDDPINETVWRPLLIKVGKRKAIWLPIEIDENEISLDLEKLEIPPETKVIPLSLHLSIKY